MLIIGSILTGNDYTNNLATDPCLWIKFTAIDVVSFTDDGRCT